MTPVVDSSSYYHLPNRHLLNDAHSMNSINVGGGRGPSSHQQSRQLAKKSATLNTYSLSTMKINSINSGKHQPAHQKASWWRRRPILADSQVGGGGGLPAFNVQAISRLAPVFSVVS